MLNTQCISPGFTDLLISLPNSNRMQYFISGLFILPPTNSPECTHMPTLQSKEPVSESKKTQEETG